MATGWRSIGNKTYYFSGSGVMQTGWQTIGGKWYYFEGSGAMVSNKWVGNYYLTGSGAMATNTWIGKYYVGSNGKWIPGYGAGSSSSGGSSSGGSSSGGSLNTYTGIAYWTPNGSKYHLTKSCRSLARSTNIQQGTVHGIDRSQICANCLHQLGY